MGVKFPNMEDSPPREIKTREQGKKERKLCLVVATTAGRIYQPPPFFPGCLGWSNFKITGLINLCPTQDFKYLFVAKAFLLPKNVNIYIQVKKIILPERNF